MKSLIQGQRPLSVKLVEGVGLGRVRKKVKGNVSPMPSEIAYQCKVFADTNCTSLLQSNEKDWVTWRAFSVCRVDLGTSTGR